LSRLLFILTFATTATFGQVDSIKQAIDSTKTSITYELVSGKTSMDHQLDSIQGVFEGFLFKGKRKNRII